MSSALFAEAPRSLAKHFSLAFPSPFTRNKILMPQLFYPSSTFLFARSTASSCSVKQSSWRVHQQCQHIDELDMEEVFTKGNSTVQRTTGRKLTSLAQHVSPPIAPLPMVRLVQRDCCTMATPPSMYSHYICAYVGVRWDREHPIQGKPRTPWSLHQDEILRSWWPNGDVGS